MALNPLNANDKPEAESSHQISTTTEVLYMTSDMGNKKLTPYKPTESAPQNVRYIATYVLCTYVMIMYLCCKW